MKFAAYVLVSAIFCEAVCAVPAVVSEGSPGSVSAYVIGGSDVSPPSNDYPDMCSGKCAANEVCAFYDHCKDLQPGMVCSAIAMYKCQPRQLSVGGGSSILPDVSQAITSFISGAIGGYDAPYSPSYEPSDMCGGQCAADEVCEFYDHCKDLKPGMVCSAVAMFKCQKRNSISTSPSSPVNPGVSSPPPSAQPPAGPSDMCGGKCAANEVCAFYDHCKDLQPGMACLEIAMFKCQKK